MAPHVNPDLTYYDVILKLIGGNRTVAATGDLHPPSYMLELGRSAWPWSNIHIHILDHFGASSFASSLLPSGKLIMKIFSIGSPSSTASLALENRWPGGPKSVTYSGPTNRWAKRQGLRAAKILPDECASHTNAASIGAGSWKLATPHHVPGVRMRWMDPSWSVMTQEFPTSSAMVPSVL